MGTLIGKAYPTSLFARAADHTYVECGTRRVAWGCWGGKTGGRVLQRATGTGSTARADAIAEPDEHAGISCYLINGVCHQAANRILSAAGTIIVDDARGYWLSESLFGMYGTLGTWPCRAPFHHHASVTGDLDDCLVDMGGDDGERAGPRGEQEPRTTAYVESVRAIYGSRDETAPRGDAEDHDAGPFQLALFERMLEFRLGPTPRDGIRGQLLEIRARTEDRKQKAATALAQQEMQGREFVEVFNAYTVEFQHDLANALGRDAYGTLLALDPEDPIVLADPAIIDRIYPQ